MSQTVSIRSICKQMQTSCVLLLWVFAFQTASGQDTTVVRRQRHEIGFAAGYTTGYGLAYRTWRGRLGAQVVFAPFKVETIERYSAGLSFFWSLVRTDISNFFIYQGNHFYSNNRYYNESYPLYDTFTNTVTGYYRDPNVHEKYWNHGAGIGYEIFRRPGKSNPFGASFMFGMATYNNFEGANLTGEVSFMYKFGKR